MVFTDYYKTLGIERCATAAAIKAAHRKMSKRFHPDVNSADEFYEDRFKDVQEAFKVLSDPKARRLYDRVYSRFSRNGIAAGNVIHIPDDAAGRPAYSWHPEYKDTPARNLVGRRGSLLLGLVVVALIGTCAILFLGKEPKSRMLVADADQFKVVSAQLPPNQQSRQNQRETAQNRVVTAVSEQRRINLPDIGVTMDVSKREESRLKEVSKPLNTPIQSLPQQRTVQPALQSLESHSQNALLANYAVFAHAAQRLPLPAQPRISSSNTVRRTDTDMSDLMVRRVTQIKYGYVTFLVTRKFQFSSGRRDEYTTMHYVSEIKVYKLGDLDNKEAIIAKAAAECRQQEDRLVLTPGQFTMNYVISSQALKIFATEIEARSSLQSEGRVMRL